jgi:hypothetical protein
VAGILTDLVRRALLSISGYEARRSPYTPDTGIVESIREQLGGNISPLPMTQTRWYLADLEDAERAADAGDISTAARLWRSMLTDGRLIGLMSTRTEGLVRLPKRFYGASEVTAELEMRNGTRSVFEEMFPPSELARIAADGIALGIGIAEMVPVSGRDYPVMVRIDPEWLMYRWNEGRWYFNSIAGPLPITPGDGRWILHVPGGRISPWQCGLWKSLGRSYINKSHALLHRSNYSAKLANPARVGVAPQGATEPQRLGFLSKIAAWGINSVFDLPVGWDLKLIESNGRGIEVFQQEIDTCDNEIMIAIAGQVVTTTGGAGFSNADIHKSIRADLIKATADALAYTINTQGIPAWVAQRWGVDALETRPLVEWDVEPPKDRTNEANSLVAVATAIQGLNAALAPYDRRVDVVEMSNRFGIPIAGDLDHDGTPEDNEGAVLTAEPLILRGVESKSETATVEPEEPTDTEEPS